MKYMVSIQFRPEQMAEIMVHVPQEQARVSELMQEGIVETLFLSADRGKVWLLMHSETLALLEDALKTLPLYPYMQLTCDPLVS